MATKTQNTVATQPVAQVAQAAQAFSIEISGTTFEIDFAALPAQSQRFIIAYGLKQKLADAGASKEDKVAAAQAMFEKLQAGNLSRAARAASDPVESIMLRLATKAIKAYVKASKVEVSEEKLEQVVSTYMEKNADALRAQAEAEIAARKDAAEKAKANAATLASLFA